MLYTLGQHGGLQDFLLPTIISSLTLMTCSLCACHRVGPIFKHLQEALDQYARMQVHVGETQVWNRGGHSPPGFQEMQEVQARVWRGEGPPTQQGVQVLGIPIGHVRPGRASGHHREAQTFG